MSKYLSTNGTDQNKTLSYELKRDWINDDC